MKTRKQIEAEFNEARFRAGWCREFAESVNSSKERKEIYRRRLLQEEAIMMALMWAMSTLENSPSKDIFEGAL